MPIKKNSAVPLYIQIAKFIEDEIDNGKYADGEIMLSEAKMQKKFDVSRITIRNAYKVLIDNGILKTIKGKGTFVNILEKDDWIGLRSFTHDVIARGRIPSTKIIEFKRVTIPEYVALNLKVGLDTECFYLKRLRFIDNKAVWLTKSYILCDIAEDLTKDYFSIKGYGQSIFRVLSMDFGVEFKEGTAMSSQNSISEEEAKLLKIDNDKPIICRSSIKTDRQDRPVVYENTIFDQSLNY